jgi:hypothetical protein
MPPSHAPVRTPVLPAGTRARAASAGVLLGLICTITAAQEGEPVAVGAGSYAPAPPAGDAKLTAALARPLPLEPGVPHPPTPSNHWWTDLLVSPYPGKLWAYPATIGCDGRGVRIWFPQGWNAGGTELVQGEPLEVQARESGAQAEAGDVVIADFEGKTWPAGWTATGGAWGEAPARGPLPGQTPITGFQGQALASSFHGGDGATGELLSAPFTINRAHLNFLVHGGRDALRLKVDLEVDGAVVRSATGGDSEQFSARSFDVGQWRGKQARVRLVDHATGGWGHLGVDQLVLSEHEDQGGGGGPFAPNSTTALRWGDWTLTMRQHAATAGRWLDVTCGRGLPYVWIEAKELDLVVPAQPEQISDLAGRPVTFPCTGDSLVIARGERLFALFAPERTRFACADGALSATFPGNERYLVVGLLPQRAQAALFKTHAYAIPRDSRFDWRYDVEAGEIATTWTVDADALRGDQRAVLQGWLPHHWRSTRNDLAFPAEAAAFATQRGQLRLAPGRSFAIAWAFNGLLPALPAPGDQAGLAHPYDAARVAAGIHAWTAERQAKPAGQRFGADTYWGGKDLGVAAQYLAIARAADLPEAPALHDLLAGALRDWFTYTPGEKEHYFARYPAQWPGLVGFKPSFGSEEFTDNHFHYGYFTLSAAMLMRGDAEFRSGFGAIATLVAKQYASWDRAATDFPRLRTFDPWAGHSYAGGRSSHEDGNNQESSSEAMQSWAGVFHLGAVLGDDAMRATGAMGYAIEGEAIREYWNDYYAWRRPAGGGNFPAQYPHTIVSVLRDRDQGFWTWFSGSPLHIYGIQWLPLSTGLQYLGRDPAFMGWQVANMLKAQGKGRAGFGFADLDGDWGNVVLGAALFGDAEATVAALDGLWSAQHAIAKDQHFALTYYLAHAYRALGAVAWDCHTGIPTSTVFHDPRTGRFTAVAYNPGAAAVTAPVWRAGRKVGSITVPASALIAIPDALPAEAVKR